MCFLNNNADILVGHIGKVSSILAKDYKPYETMDLAKPREEDFKKFILDRAVVTEKIFMKLKTQDDDIRR